MRTYSVECPELMRMLLHHTTANPQVSWLLGVWIGRDAAANKAQVT
jgi:exo-beta-1,3-glucanase (GH17 family)